MSTGNGRAIHFKASYTLGTAGKSQRECSDTGVCVNDMLNEVDTSRIEPTAQVLAQSNVMRDDVPRASRPADVVLANAPAKEESFFRVPAVLDEAARSGQSVESEASDIG